MAKVKTSWENINFSPLKLDLLFPVKVLFPLHNTCGALEPSFELVQPRGGLPGALLIRFPLPLRTTTKEGQPIG